MALLDEPSKKPSRYNNICQIVDFSLGGVERSDVYSFGQKVLGLTRREVDAYLKLLSLEGTGLVHVTEDLCETTYKGFEFLKDSSELSKKFK